MSFSYTSILSVLFLCKVYISFIPPLNEDIYIHDNNILNKWGFISEKKWTYFAMFSYRHIF